MSSPRERLPLPVQWDVQRYLSYGWKDALILSLVARRHGWHLSHACLRALRRGEDCPRKCPEACWLRQESLPKPDLRWLDELEKKQRRPKEDEVFRYDIGV